MSKISLGKNASKAVPTVLDFLYTGQIAIDEENAVALFLLSGRKPRKKNYVISLEKNSACSVPFSIWEVPYNTVLHLVLHFKTLSP